MTYSDDYNIRTKNVKFNDVADAIDGVITRTFAGTTTGTSSAYISSPSPAWQSYTASAIIIITPHTTNAAGATIQINSLAAKELRIGGAAIAAGVLQTGVPTILAYTGAYFEVLLQSMTTPVGQITAYAGSTAPIGWLLCDGSSQSTTGPYAALHGIIGYTYGGSGASFNLPDLQRRAPVGKGASDTLGGSDGVAYASRSMSHSHTIGHTHTIPNHQHTVPGHVHGLAGHTHTVNSHSHPLSDAGAAALDFTSTNTYARRPASAAWTSTHIASPAQGWTSTALSRSLGLGLVGNTDAASPGTSGPSVSTTSGAPADTTGFSTAAGEGGVSTNSQTGTTSGSNTQQHLFVNYIIKF